MSQKGAPFRQVVKRALEGFWPAGKKQDVADSLFGVTQSTLDKKPSPFKSFILINLDVFLQLSEQSSPRPMNKTKEGLAFGEKKIADVIVIARVVL